MMGSSRLKEDKNKENIIIKDIRNLFRLKEENKSIKQRISKDIIKLFLSMKKTVIINRYKQIVFGITIALNLKVTDKNA